MRSSLVYFVLYDLSRVDPMYQFSLDTYFTLFRQSIDGSRDPAAPPENVTERCKIISFYHTLNVYKYTCLGLFERHKLLFSLLLCIRILTNDKKVNQEELNFVYYGGSDTDRSMHKRTSTRVNSLARLCTQVTRMKNSGSQYLAHSPRRSISCAWIIVFCAPPPSVGGLDLLTNIKVSARAQ